MSFLIALRRGDWLNLRRVKAYPRLFLAVFVLAGLAWIFGLQERTKPEEGLAPDFVNVYAAGLAVHEGHPAEAFDDIAQRNREVRLERQNEQDGFIPWLYPPMFLSVAWLVSFLPYFAALGAYSILGLFAYGSALRSLVPPYKESLWALAAFPAVFVNLFSGQNGFITTALLAAGLYLLDEFPIASGTAFGILSYKPQCFVLIPVALAVGRYWKALAATLVSAAVCAALSLAAFGFVSWRAFLDSLPTARKIFLERDDAALWLGNIHSVFSMARLYGGNVETAYTLQTVVAVATMRRTPCFLASSSAMRPAL